MKINQLLILSLTWLTTSLDRELIAQAFVKSTANVSELSSNYNTQVQVPSVLFNGSLYYTYDTSLETHPFFVSNTPILGEIIYEGRPFGPYFFLYDISKNVVAVQHPSNGMYVELKTHKIQQLILETHQFVSLDSDMKKSSSGIFEMVVDGKTIDLVAERKKERISTVFNKRVEVEFKVKDRFYILENDDFFEINSSRELQKKLQLSRADLRNVQTPHSAQATSKKEQNYILLVHAFNQMKAGNEK